jgi:hypothetical protein
MQGQVTPLQVNSIKSNNEDHLMKSSTKKDSKLHNEVLATYSNIFRIVKDPQNTPEDLEQALKRYKHVQEALNYVENPPRTPAPLTLLSQALVSYLHTPNQQERFKKFIEIFLRFGAKGANIPNGEEPVSPILILYDPSLLTVCRNPKKHKTADLLALFLKDPDNLKVTGPEKSTLAHLTAYYDLDSLKIVHHIAPELLEARTSRQDTPLFFAVEHNEEAALWLINEAKVHVDVQDFNGLNALCYAIQRENTNLIKALLDRQSPLLFDRRVIDVNYPEKKVVSLLEESGYFLVPSPHAQRIYFTFVNNQQRHKVASVADLEALRFAPSPLQIQRLHCSFLEALNQGDQQTVALYSAFCKKFPNPNPTQTVVTQKKPDPFKEIHDPDTVRTILVDYLEGIPLGLIDEQTFPSRLTYAKQVLHLPCMSNLSRAQMSRLIEDFYATSLNSLPFAVAEKKVNLNFSAHLHLEFARTVLLDFLERATQEELTAFHEKLIYLVSVAGITLEYSPQKGEQILYFQLRMEEIYKKKSLPASYLLDVQTTNNLRMLSFYFEQGFYQEGFNLLIEVHKNKSLFMNEESRFIWTMTLRFLKFAKAHTKMHDHTLWPLEQQWQFIDVVVFFASLPYAKKNYSQLCTEVLQLCTHMRANVQERYFTLCSDLVRKKSPLLHFTMNKSLHRIDVHFTGAVDAKQLGKTLQTLANVHKVGDDFYIKYLAQSLEDIESTLNDSVAISANQVPEKIPTKVEEPKEQSQSQDTPSSTYLPEPAFATPKTLPRMHTPKAATGSSSSACITTAPPAKTHDFEAIKNTIRSKLKLGDDVELFPIKNPLFPESRQHLLWACWKNGFVQFQHADEHKKLLQEFGQLALRNKNANGLKSVSFFNTDTHIEARSLKTKRVCDNERIVGVPYTLGLQSNDLATVYCFGVLTQHAKPQLKISPKEFLEHFQAHAQRNSNSNAGPSSSQKK